MIPGASFNPLALDELHEAAAYYEAQSAGLGLALVDEVEATVDALRRHPKSGPEIGRSLRCRVLDRFPYSLIYRLVGEELRILALAHQRRRPRYWYPRS